MTEQKEPLQAKEAVKDTPELNEAVTPENEAGFEGATGVDEAAEASAAEVGVAEEDDESEADESPEAALAAERDQLQDRLLRLSAEFDNYKKRMIRENSERLRYSSFELLAGLLPTLDNLERAIAHAKKEESTRENMIEGLELVCKMTMDTLVKHGVSKISAQGEVFDPTRHQAVGMVETTDVPNNHVAEECQVGYTLHERILRPAMVRVAGNK
jgi:molecular chaperone GrpE